MKHLKVQCPWAYVLANASIKPYLQVKLVAITVYYDKISLV